MAVHLARRHTSGFFDDRNPEGEVSGYLTVAKKNYGTEVRLFFIRVDNREVVAFFRELTVTISRLIDEISLCWLLS
ncbi:hypothetical protein CHARACLAT_010732 [Characodon lateralis]|uniref:Uncharacterized protein n=1 Tax=Characodon lateralis TaxID=208331 RepID=A0ABU7DZN0_9TELE|nr:hypothetical protein [Characodon lateralis]